LAVIEVGVVGGTGYTGVELLRVLVRHPKVALRVVTSRSEAGVPVADLFPSLRGYCDLRFVEPRVEDLAACDVIFFATPHGVAQAMVAQLWHSDVRIIDLSADFRIRDIGVWERWYEQPHACPELVEQAVYGLPEKHREAIADARLLACPGCYPTAVQLGFWPLLSSGVIETEGLIANVASGVSGAGRQAKMPLLFAEMGESFKAYSVAGHRHQPEIAQGLSEAAGSSVDLTFVPHLVPMTRGIHATLYGRLRDTGIDLQALYEAHYAGEAFVDVLPAGSHPETRSVKGSNLCRLAVHRPGDGDTVVVLSVIDNLAKGAATQAVQNLNIMFALSESMGLDLVPLVP
jgi:N-acetyl-gamma-glutamyl-phosphate reductase